jgi:transcription elongation GreA/GreB family factor
MIPKSDLLAEVCRRLSEQLESLQKSLSDSKAAATDPDSKAESKYDTRSLEMSYLVNGQDRQLAGLRESLACLADFEPQEFSITDEVRMGALVELNRDGEWEHYFLLPAGGGLTLSFSSVPDWEVTTLSPESPLYTKLEGQTVGDELANDLRITELS